VVTGADDMAPEIAYRAQSLHARFLFQAGDLPGARDLFATANRGRPDYKESVKGLADTQRRLGDAEAAEHWSEVLSLLLSLTDDEYVRKRPAVRQERLARLVEIHPAYEDAFQQLAELQRRAGDMAGACATIEAFLEQHGGRVAPEDTERLRQRFCKDS